MYSDPFFEHAVAALALVVLVVIAFVCALVGAMWIFAETAVRW